MNMQQDAFDSYKESKSRKEEQKRRETRHFFVPSSHVVVKVICASTALREVFFCQDEAIQPSSDLLLFLHRLLINLTSSDSQELPSCFEIVCSNELSLVIQLRDSQDTMSFQHQNVDGRVYEYPLWPIEVVLQAKAE